MKKLLLLFFAISHLAMSQDPKLIELANTKYLASDDQAADSLYRIIIAEHLKTKPKDSTYVVYAYKLAFSNSYLKRNNEALKWYKEAYELSNQLKETDDIAYVKLCKNIAFFLEKNGYFKEAGPYFWEYKAKAAEVAGIKSAEYASACNSLSLYLNNADENEKALEFMLESLKLREEIGGKSTKEYANGIQNLASIYRDMGDLKKSEEQQLIAIDLFEKISGKNSLDYAISISNLANNYQFQGYFTKAEQLFKEARDIYIKSKATNNSMYALITSNMGTMYVRMEKLLQAEELLLEAKAIREKTLGKKSTLYAETCNNLSAVYFAQRNFRKAEELLLEVKRIRAKEFGELHTLYAMSCTNLGIFYASIKLDEKADAYFKEALHIREKNKLTQHPDYGKACSQYADFLLKRQEADSALVYLKRAEAILEKNNADVSIDYARVVMNIGRSYFKKGEYPKAELLLLKSAAIYEKALGKKSKSYSLVCNFLAALYQEIGRFQEAQKYSKICMDIFRTYVEQLFPALSESEKLDFVGTETFSLKNYFYFSAEHLKETPSLAKDLFDNVLFSKGIVFHSNEQMKKQILDSQNEALISKYETWRMACMELSKLLETSEEELEKRGISLKTEMEKVNVLEKELSKSTGYSLSTLGKEGQNWQALRAKLKKGEALIECLRIGNEDDSKYLFLLLYHDSSCPEYLIVDKANSLEGPNLQYYKKALELKKEDKLSYLAYWKPLEEKLAEHGKMNKVYFSPDGVYHKVNLKTLFNAEKGQYLFENTSLVLLSNSKDLLLNNEQNLHLESSLKKQKAYFFGYPQYDLENQSVDSSQTRSARYSSTQNALGVNMEWSALVGTKKEVEQISSNIKSKGLLQEVYLGKEATEENLKQCKDPIILHIATHGYFLEAPADSLRSMETAEKVSFTENPLRRSGLVLAGCKNAKEQAEDGILTAQEALNLSLSNTAMVVLSACETGLGDIQSGEGVFGLQRAFLQAGAKSIVMSLWKVSDEATQLLMTQFYDELLKGKSKHVALQLAQNKVKKQFPHPYYWGAFVLVGQ